MTALHELPAADLHAAYASGELSPVDVARAVLERIDACEPTLRAMYVVHRDASLAAARESERRWRAGAPLSSIDGVPVTLKENLYTRGDPAPIGTAAGDRTPRAHDAPPSARVRDAGAVIVGKTTMPDFGMLTSGVSSLHGTTRNPWNVERNPGGSSSGAGAAGAAGYGPLHLGTDIGGSIRLPAHYCGLFGLKPSYGRVPIDPPYIHRVAGPMTRTVRDSAMLMEVLSRPDARDWTSLPPQRIEYAALLDGLSPRGLRIGVLTDMRAGLPVDPRVRGAVEAAARALEAAGAIVEPIAPCMTPQMLDGWCRFFEARSHRDVAAMDAEARSRVLPFVLEWCTWRAHAFSGDDVMGAFAQIMALREHATRATLAHDFLLMPVAPRPPHAATAHSPSDDPRDALSHIAFTLPWNVGEQPAASVNWDFTPDGLPIGVQLVGRRFDDLGVMRLARAIEQVRPPQRPWPATV